jgi:hypothetical protein
MLTLAGGLEAADSAEEAIHLELPAEILERLARCQADRPWEAAPCGPAELWPLEMPESWLE